MREGPKLTVVASCDGCQYQRSLWYIRQGDSGRDVHCLHPSHTRRVDGCRTPDWCTLLPAAMARLKDDPR